MKKSNKFPIKGWKWIFYIFGWLNGALNLGFWIIMYLTYMVQDWGDPFFNNRFHKRVVIWGYITSVAWLLMIIFLIYIYIFY